MKTSIQTIFATGLIALAISTSTVQANAVNETTVSANAVSISSIKRLIVKGNVEVTISQDSKSKVLYTNEGTQQAVVKKVGNALYVSSLNNTPGAKITVYVDDIYRIEASEEATVLTGSELNLKYLQVFLTDNAKVELNAKTENLYTTIKKASKLNLKGSTDSYTIDMDKSSRIALERFNSKKTDMSSSDVYVASRG